MFCFRVVFLVCFGFHAFSNPKNTHRNFQKANSEPIQFKLCQNSIIPYKYIQRKHTHQSHAHRAHCLRDGIIPTNRLQRVSRRSEISMPLAILMLSKSWHSLCKYLCRCVWLFYGICYVNYANNFSFPLWCCNKKWTRTYRISAKIPISIDDQFYRYVFLFVAVVVCPLTTTQSVCFFVFLFLFFCCVCFQSDFIKTLKLIILQDYNNNNNIDTSPKREWFKLIWMAIRLIR